MVVDAVDQGDQAAEWLSRFFTQVGLEGGDFPPSSVALLVVENKFRLMKFRSRGQRVIDLFGEKGRAESRRVLATGRFSDGHPIQVASESTIEKISELGQMGEPVSVTERRFRFNVVLGDIGGKKD